MKHVEYILAVAVLAALLGHSPAQCKESFDKAPNWDGHNNRIARELEPRTVRQDFGYSAKTDHAGGEPGEIGGLIQPAMELAYYAKSIPAKSMKDPLRISGKMLVGKGSGNSLFGFFNDKTLNEWRTPNALVFRINARGDVYQAHAEFTSRKWRATAGIIGSYNPVTDRNHALELPCDVVHEWSLEYDPEGNSGNGRITFAVAGNERHIDLTPDLREDGATYNRFGILNVMKSHDGSAYLWLDDIEISGEKQDFSRDPKWKGMRNRATFPTTRVRPWFDFGYSPTNYAGGRAPGELGGIVYRGDCRYPERMACYGDRLKTLTLVRPLRASGKVALRRGVTDSTSAIGFYNSVHSMAVTDSQQFGTPRDFLGIYIEGPSGQGFYFYPAYRNHEDDPSSGYPNDRPHILPDGATHDWTLVYDPMAANGNGRITVTLDDKVTSLDLAPAVKSSGATFDRFGIVTPWVDGNGQEVYFDDLEYTSQ